MQSFRAHELAQALVALGLRRGDIVCVHSALFALGPMAGHAISALPEQILAALQKRIGPQGTLVVPTFNFDFCKDQPFDRQNSPAQAMGAFSEYLRCRPQARRSPHAMQSLSAIGPAASTLAERDTPGAFDEGSSFEYLIDANALILMLGCGINAVSLIHYSEQKVGVPYRFFKDFSAMYRDQDRIERRRYRMYARDLVQNPQVRVEPVGRVLRRRSEMRRLPLGRGRIKACRARPFTAAAICLLQRDPWALVRPTASHAMETLNAAP